MADYPREFEFDALLRDGEVVRLRPITPDDAELEHEFIHRVGPQSMYQRFFRAKNDLSPEELRYFTTIDYEDRMAFIALIGERMVAVGRYDVSPEHEDERIAEVAFLVEDAFQGRGIGSLLLQHLTAYARLKGVTGFEAFVLADNFGMMRLFRSSGYTVVRSLDEDVYRVEFPTDYSPAARAADFEHERRSVTASLTPLFLPRAVVVVDAEPGVGSTGGRIIENVRRGNYTGILHPVNVDREFVHSVKAYRSVHDVPDRVDLAVLTGPPESTLDQLSACGRKGVRAAVVTSWANDPEGEWRGRLLRAARRAGLRLLGPDSSGLVVTYPEVAFHAHTGTSQVAAGRIAIAAQSGALGLAILHDVEQLGAGLSSFLSLGDAADITANDALLYWEGDPFTEVILLYVEDFGNPRRFGRLARRVARSKPVVAVKGGRTGFGRDTSSAEGAVEALFRASGVIRAETLAEMLDVAMLLDSQPLPTGRHVQVVADAPGPAALAAGAVVANGLEMAVGAVIANPSVVDGPELREAVETALGDTAVDAVIVVEARSDAPDLPFTLDGNHKPVVGVQMGREWRRPTPIPMYGYPEPAVRALGAVVRYAEWRAQPEGAMPEFPDVARADTDTAIRRALGRLGPEGGELDTDESLSLLANYGIRGVEALPDEVGAVAISMTEDAVFGPLITFRMAGALAELTGDAAFRINPLSDSDAAGMVAEVRSARVLTGFGGATSGDVEALQEGLLRLSYLVENHPEIHAVDLDPVGVAPEGGGIGVHHARIVLRPLPGAFAPSRKDVPGRMLS